jgi:hypothetical protein
MNSDCSEKFIHRPLCRNRGELRGTKVILPISIFCLLAFAPEARAACTMQGGAPNAEMGAIVYDIDKAALQYCDGVDWVPVPPGAASGGHLVMGTARSDRRVTTNIRPLDGGLDTIMRLRPVSFEYIDAYKAARTGLDGLRRGFIAQEIEPVIPEMVRTVDENFGDHEIGDFRLLTNSSEFMPLLVKAVQELEEENEALRARVDALERAPGTAN